MKPHTKLPDKTATQPLIRSTLHGSNGPHQQPGPSRLEQRAVLTDHPPLEPHQERRLINQRTKQKPEAKTAIVEVMQWLEGLASLDATPFSGGTLFAWTQ